ncbi:MAG: SBBP repeat-containing protein [Ignavibacteria bacterium]|nr:SBBP repeat-containing protein [Ignavibacteria bacterium]
MKRTIILFLIFVTTSVFSQVSQQWASRYNAFESSNENLYDMKYDGSGNIYLCGASDSIATLSDAIVLKYNSNGVLLWSSRYNGPVNGFDNAYSIALDNSGNIYYTGSSQGSGSGYDLIIVKLNSAGVQQWVHRINGTANQSDFGTSIAVDNSGNVYCCGNVNRTGSNEDIVAVKLNTSGAQQWIEYYNWVNGFESSQKLLLDASGNVYITGRSVNASNNYDIVTLKYNNSGANQFSVRYNGVSNGDDYASNMDIDASGNIFVCGVSLTASSGNEGVLIRYNSSGVEQWVSKYNYLGAFDDGFEDVKIDNSGNIFVCGYSESSDNVSSFATIKYSNAGSITWVQRYSGPIASAEGARSLYIDNAQNVIVTGSGVGLNTDFDIVTVKYTNAGSQVWDQRYNFAGAQDHGYKITGDNTGSIYVAGYSYSPSTPDIVLVKYSQPSGVEPVSGNIPVDYFLSQNFPNPFNPETKINFSLPQDGFTELIVFDVTGKAVETIVKENLNAGEYSVDFDAAGLTSGVYFYRISSNGYSVTKKMILIK